MSLRAPPKERSPAALLAFGVVNLDKPPGPSAHQVADWVRRMVAKTMGEAAVDGDHDGETPALADREAELAGTDEREGIDRAAHTGTLDPKVTGCLPMLLGEATRLAQVFADSTKEYVAVLELHGPPPADLAAILSEFEGDLYQKPPRKSAVSRQLRTRTVHDIEILERDGRHVLLRVRCEAGTYIRKLCHDLGLALGTGAHMGDLRRTATGHYDDTTLVSMEDLADALAFWVEDGDAVPLRNVVQPAERLLEGLPRVIIAENAAEQVAEGAPIYAPGVIEMEPAPLDGTEAGEGDLVAGFVPNGSAVCLGRLVGDPSAERGTVVELERVLV